MPKPFPDPNFNTSTQMMQYTSVVTDGWMFPLILIASYVIIFLIVKSQVYRTSDSLLVSGFCTFILASLFWGGGLISGVVVVFPLLLTIAAGIYCIFDK